MDKIEKSNRNKKTMEKEYTTIIDKKYEKTKEIKRERTNKQKTIKKTAKKEEESKER